MARHVIRALLAQPKRLFVVATAMGAMLCAIAPTNSMAQQKLFDLRAEARVDYQREYVGGETDKDASGFKGRFVNLIANGDISDNFSYSYRQRLIKANSEQSFFDAIDWITLTWKASNHWSASAGKQIVAIGGYEYDRAPIDLYFCSEYWNNIGCYQLGISATYAFNDGRDKITAQVCQSPFRYNAGDMYAYNIMWSGAHGCLSTIYSANMMEYMPGRYISYIALGHRLDFGAMRLELDFMNRAADKQTFFFSDCSLMGELAYRPADVVSLFAKVTYDVNKTSRLADYSVRPGTELTYVGGGAEIFPLKGKRDVRLHVAYAHSFGTNGNAEGAIRPNQDYVDVGLTWRVDLLSVANKLTSNK